jgi:hypothetical protein
MFTERFVKRTGPRVCSAKIFFRFIFLATIFLSTISCDKMFLANAQEMSIAERVLFHSANRERFLQNLPPLKWDESLATAARRHAALMAKLNTLAHELPDEERLALRATHAGAHFVSVAENIAKAANAEDAHQSWMNSPGHRANILNPQLTALGVGVVVSGENVFAVEDFSQAVSGMSLQEQEQQVLKLLAENGIATGKASEDARSVCNGKNAINAPRPRFEAEFEVGDLTRLPEELAQTIKTGRYSHAAVGACEVKTESPFTRFRLAVLLF